MGYRIYLNKVKKNALNEYLMRTEDRFFDESNELELNCITELNDNTPIEDYTYIERFKEDEYGPHLLNKDDFLKLLNYYRDFIYQNLKEKEFSSRKTENNLSFNMFFHGLTNYFEALKVKDVLIKSSSVFMLDYFYLIKEYENMKEDELLIITHG